MKHLELNVGDKVVVEPLGNAKIRGKDVIYDGVVTKIGRRYYYISINNRSTSEAFDKKTLFHRDLNNHFEYQAYTSYQEYLDEVARRKLLQVVRQGFTYYGNSACNTLTLRDLQVISVILFKNETSNEMLDDAKSAIVELIESFPIEADRNVLKQIFHLEQEE